MRIGRILLMGYDLCVQRIMMPSGMGSLGGKSRSEGSPVANGIV